LDLFTNEIELRAKRKKESGDKVIIKLLGQLEIDYQGNQINYVLKKARKTRRLIAYLILSKGSPISVHHLYEQLWDEESIDNPESSLKTLVSRTRAMFAQADPALRDLIVAHTGAYAWNMSLTEEIDVFRVEDLAAEILAYNEDCDAFRKRLGEMVCLYSGRLLPEMSTDENVLVYEMRVEEQYKKAIDHTVALFEAAKADDMIIRTCRMALVVMPYEDSFHISLIRALIRLNRRGEALAQYRYVTEATMRYFGMRPSKQIQDVLAEIIRADEMLEKAINTIAAELTEESDFGGAYVCDYGIFKDIYRLQIRSLDRTDITCYLVIVKVTAQSVKNVNPLELDNVMKRLQDILQMSLRVCDIITRYTATQFALLLRGAPSQSLQSIITRVRMSFYSESVYEQIGIDYIARGLDGKSIADE